MPHHGSSLIRRPGLALLPAVLVFVSGAAPPDPDRAPVDPAQQYANLIRIQASALRAGDEVPASLEAWRTRRAAVRKGLLDAWGGFPNTPCPLEPKLLGTLHRDGYRVEKVVFQTRPDVWMTANAYVPDGPGKHAAILNVHGHWAGAKQDPVVQSRCIGAVKLGFFVLVVDAFGAGERGVKKALGEYHGDLTGATLLPVGLPLAGLQVYENMRAVDYLQTRPEVDPDRIGITGASGGGNQTMYSGAIDERLKAVVPVCSVGNYPVYLRAACCMCELVPGALRFADEWGVLGLIAPRALMIVNASKDAVQFSVAEANMTVRPLEQLYRLHDIPGRLKHAVFDSKHDYNRAMREAMYGWMTLHLKGQGDGAPIAEPEVKTEDPETLRCYPGESRPEGFTTIPRFAAAEGRRLLAARTPPATADGWRLDSDSMRTALVEKVLGGFPAVPAGPVMMSFSGGIRMIDFEREPGLRLGSWVASPNGAPLAIVLDLDERDAADREAWSEAFHRAGWGMAHIPLRATTKGSLPPNKPNRAGDHDLAEWGMWVGRPLLGQWVFDVRRFLDTIGRSGGKPDEVVLIGRGSAGVVALCAAAVDRRITKVAAVGTLASYITEMPYKDQRLGIMAPGMLRDVGDVAHLAALCAPKRVVIAGGVAGDGHALPAAALREAYEPALRINKLLDAEKSLSLIEGTDPAQVVRALKD